MSTFEMYSSLCNEMTKQDKESVQNVPHECQEDINKSQELPNTQALHLGAVRTQDLLLQGLPKYVNVKKIARLNKILPHHRFLNFW